MRSEADFWGNLIIQTPISLALAVHSGEAIEGRAFGGQIQAKDANLSEGGQEYLLALFALVWPPSSSSSTADSALGHLILDKRRVPIRLHFVPGQQRVKARWAQEHPGRSLIQFVVDGFSPGANLNGEGFPLSPTFWHPFPQ